MRTINFTLDNWFRNPLRWGKCPMNIGRPVVFGFIYNKMSHPHHIKDIWYLNLYFYKWVRTISNYPIK